MPSAVVTGGSRGIGLQIVRRLAASGYDVIAVARGMSGELREALEESGAGHGAVHFRPADLSDIGAIPSLAKSLRQEFGSVHVLVNNAGGGTGNLLAVMHDNEIERIIALNAHAPIVLTKYVARSMIADRVPGRIINISSVVAQSGFKGLAPYSAGKAAMIGFTRSLARELGPADITVNAIAPGLVETQLTASLGAEDRERIMRRTPLRRLVEAEDVANAVAFLVSDAARHITGIVLTIDAGASA